MLKTNAQYNQVDLEKKSQEIRLCALRACTKSGYGYTGEVMSAIEILVALYYGDLYGEPVMRFDAQKPGADEQDYVVFSKSTLAPAAYAILADLGFFEGEQLNYFAQIGSLLSGRPRMKLPGISVSNLTMGHGLSSALGLALSLKMERKVNRVFTVLSDQELQCGQVWEAALAASHNKLNNLIAFVDNNGFQPDGLIKSILDLDYLQSKFEAFGWKVIRVLNGNDCEEILNALNRAFTSNRQPVCIWCKTLLGKGIDFVEGKQGYLDVPLSWPEMEEVENSLMVKDE